MQHQTDALPECTASQAVGVVLPTRTGGATSKTEQVKLPEQCWVPANLYCCWALSTSVGGSKAEQACLANHPRDLHACLLGAAVSWRPTYGAR